MSSVNPKDLFGSLKPPLDLIPPAAELHLAMAMGNGAVKYGAFNWRTKRVRASIYIAAAKRHLAAYLDGERIDEDSGHHHLGHAMACLAILLDAEATGNLIDDRPPAGAAAALIKSLTGAALPSRRGGRSRHAPQKQPAKGGQSSVAAQPRRARSG